MVGAYLTDIVDLRRDTVDSWGSPTSVPTADVPARVEDQVRIVRGQDGKEFTSQHHIFFRDTVTVDYQTFIALRSRCGVAAELPAKFWPVKKLTKSHMFGVMCWEVWL